MKNQNLDASANSIPKTIQKKLQEKEIGVEKNCFHGNQRKEWKLNFFTTKIGGGRRDLIGIKLNEVTTEEEKKMGWNVEWEGDECKLIWRKPADKQ
jgi:hypothetical protein